MVPDRSEDEWYQTFCRNMIAGNVCATNDIRWSQESRGETTNNFRSVQGDNRETAKDMRRSFKAKTKAEKREVTQNSTRKVKGQMVPKSLNRAAFGTIPKLRKTCKEDSKRRTKAEKGRDSLETQEIQNSHFTDEKVKQNHKIFNIPITILAKKTAEKH